MIQFIPVPGLMQQAERFLLQEQLGLIQQRQVLSPSLLIPRQQQQAQFQQQQQQLPVQTQTPSVVIPTPPTPAPVDSTFIFTQLAPATVWNINHNLGQFPSVTLVDSLGNVIMAAVQYINSNLIVATFSVPVAGLAFLNV